MRAGLVHARPEHIPHLAEHMRAADREEVWAWSMADPETSLRRSLEASALAWTGVFDDEPVCMFGVGSTGLLGSVGVPWLLGTDAIERIPATFARMSVAALRLLTIYPVLANWSDARHKRAHDWLAWLGFDLGEPQPMGALGLPFRPFAMRCSHV